MRRDLPSNLANKLRRHVLPNKLSLVLLETNKCRLKKMMTKAKIIREVKKSCVKGEIWKGVGLWN